jgi:ABC-2 type transport system ATP-binding protein
VDDELRVLELTGLSKRYGDVVALDDLHITIPSGEVFGLLGPNGAGKTTAMRIVMGVLIPDSGRVAWNDHGITMDDRRRFGYLPEERGLYPDMTAIDHLVYLCRLHGLSRSEGGSRGTEWLERLGLGERSKDKISTLSLGNQQRVQLAAALVHSPEVLILDEPFSGLDPIGIDMMGGVLADVAASGATVVFSSHQLDLVEDRCRSVAILNRGRLVANGSVEDLTTAGRTRLVVEVDGAPRGWADRIAGVTVSEAESGGARVRLVLNDQTDAQVVLEEAQRLGMVKHFSFERLRLSEVFREAVAA